MIVLQASMGMRKILKQAADAEAAMVLTPTGNFAVTSDESIKAKAPAFAAVSPNLAKGPWNSAGPSPR